MKLGENKKNSNEKFKLAIPEPNRKGQKLSLTKSSKERSSRGVREGV